MPRKFDNTSIYKQDFSVYHDDINKQNHLNDSLKRNEFKDKMRKGTLSPSKKLPFEGHSTTKNNYTYQKNRIEKPEKCLPRDEVIYSIIINNYSCLFHIR
jgi:hypothetical protein